MPDLQNVGILGSRIHFLFRCRFCGGIGSFCSGSVGRDISWVVIVLAVTVRYLWSSDGGGDDDMSNIMIFSFVF